MDRGERFVRLLGQHQRRLYLYVIGLVLNPTEAEEVLQETNLVLWREFDSFEEGTNFAAWACRIAFHQVLAWRKRRQRDRLQFSDEFLRAVAAEAEALDDHLEDRAAALSGCISKLPEKHRDLLKMRYSDGLPVEDIAQRDRRSADAVYRALSRVRAALFDCVTRTLAAGGRP